MSKVQRSTATQFENLTLSDQLKRAMPIARGLLANGITNGSGRVGNETIVSDVAAVANDLDLTTWYKQASDHDLSLLSSRLAAARALGLALGLMLRPEMFTGGVR